MGSVESKDQLVNTIGESRQDLKKFVEVFSPIAVKDSHGLSLRVKEWSLLDYNAGGKVSLAECWGWIENKLLECKSIQHKDEALHIYKKFRPSYIVAFNDAKDIGKPGTDEDYITKREFRVLVAYFCIYAAVEDCFSLIDGGGNEHAERPEDRRISMEEWLKAYPILLEQTDFEFAMLEHWRDEDSNKKDPEEIFQDMDSDNAGMVLLNEFCDFFKTNEIEAKTPIGDLLNIGE